MVENIDLFIFSKDRACQLDLLIRSKHDNFPIPDRNTWVLYKVSNDEYRRAYNILIAKYPQIHWVEEGTSLLNQTRSIFSNLNNPYILLSVDDNVFINPPLYLAETMAEYAADQRICAFSIRMNPHINYCQPANLRITIPPFIKNDRFILWDWTKCDKRGDWGYPHPTDSHIYRSQYIKHLINTVNFHHSGSFESQINMMRDPSKPYLVAMKRSCMMSIPNNSTQAGWANVTGNDRSMSIESLNTQYLNGFVISTSNLYGVNNTACHTVIPYIMVKI